MENSKNYNVLAALISKAKFIVIVTHYKPDGDAIGSATALYNYLLKLGKKVSIVIPSEYPDFLNWMIGASTAIDAEKKLDEAVNAINEADLLFCLDFNQFERTELLASILKDAAGTKVLIDHHINPDPSFDFIFSDTKACATCQLIFELIVALGHQHLIDQAIAESLYCGIMTDTGSFRFERMQPEVHHIIAALQTSGARNYKVHEWVYDQNSFDRLKLLGFALNNCLTKIDGYAVTFIALSANDLNKFDHKTGDTEGLVNYALSVKGTKMAALFTEKQGVIKISFRSKDEFSVQEFSRKYFNGGGHFNAAGGRSNLSLEETVIEFISKVKLYDVLKD